MWFPFPQINWVRGGVSTVADGTMFWGRAPDAEVAANRRRFLESIDVDPAAAVAMEQIHAAGIAIVKYADRGRGIADPATRLAGIDAMITQERGTALVAAHADCAPVFLLHPETKTIAAIHAGWRGALAGIGSKTVRALESEFGCRPSELLVAVGPLISRGNYEVGEEVAAPFEEAFGARVVDRGGTKPKLDLFAVIAVDLLTGGVSPAALPARPPCTFGSPRFSSWRRDGLSAGGAISVIINK